LLLALLGSLRSLGLLSFLGQDCTPYAANRVSSAGKRSGASPLGM
jgi:hypothetical protein